MGGVTFREPQSTFVAFDTPLLLGCPPRCTHLCNDLLHPLLHVGGRLATEGALHAALVAAGEERAIPERQQ